MLYRIECWKQDGSLLYALETTCFYQAHGHYWGAEVNPEIAEVVYKLDRHDGKGMQELDRRTTNHN